MASQAPRHVRRVMLDCRRALKMTQAELAEAIGVSSRTVIRWEKGHASLVADQVREIAGLVREEDEELADELFVVTGVSAEDGAAVEVVAALEALPAPAPKEPETVSAPPGPAPTHLIDAVLFAAADAVDMVPRAVTPAVVAAFTRAHELGLGIEAVVEGLATRLKD
jgi:transcriptional regulator with XRE-family HTH domain